MDPWRGKWATEGGGVLMNQAVHSIDHFQWFMGRAVEVSGRIATLRHGGYIDVEDTAVATVRFESGALGVDPGQLDVSARLWLPGRRKRGQRRDDQRLGAQRGRARRQRCLEHPRRRGPTRAWLAEDDGKEGFPDYHVLQIQDFLQAILADRDPAVTGAEARKSLEIILAIYESSRTSLPISLPMPSAG